MQKAEAVISIGKRSLLMPAWIHAALASNDRLKLFLSVVQAAVAHAEHPGRQALDLAPEMGAAQGDAAWLSEMPATAMQVDGAVRIPNLQRFARRAGEELGVMARPVLEAQDSAPRERVQYWLAWLGKIEGDRLTREQLHALTAGTRANGDDSLHLLVMDLHRQLAELERALATEDIDGAHAWQVLPEDRLRIAAFMRGLNRTAPLRLDHPGLGTAATRDGEKLLLQNDIGANDVHVLVVQVQALTITVSYADLHRLRFEFFQSLLEPFGAHWDALQSRLEPSLNDGQPFIFGTARFECVDEESLDAALEGIGSRIVFLIDWNRARKRLLPFVGKDVAVGVLQEAARLEFGHMAWLRCGGEDLVYRAMQAVGARAFRIGDRLDAVLGATDAHSFLVDVMRLASQAMLSGKPVAQVSDQTRLLLLRFVRQRSSEFELLEEHAAYCHALAQAVSDALEHDVMNTSYASSGAGHADLAKDLAVRAKTWEREADELVTRAREKAQRQPRWEPFARVIESSDDIADALEEAAFVISLIADGHQSGWNEDIRDTICGLAHTVLVATQEHIKALAIARDLAGGNDMSDSDAFVAATWNVLRSERRCDDLLRDARRFMLASIKDSAALMLANDLAQALELASDRLLAAGYMLRDAVFGKEAERA
ncbi:MAG: phosphate transport regulator [Cupriavidus sp.]|nr:phosphate transport regulator [Cupriavidus sp.]